MYAMLSVKVEQFEGPLDLLLQLIQNQELDITQISLAQVTDQYLQHLKSLAQGIHVEELADFLVVASRLILIKSRALLPDLTPDEQEDLDQLTRQLKMYQEFAYASKLLAQVLGHHRVSFVRPFIRSARLSVFSPPLLLDGVMLANAFQEVIDHIEPTPPVRRIVIDPQINLQETITRLKERLLHDKSFRFQDLINKAQSKTEVIVQFLAILELVKQQVATLSQEPKSHEIEVVPV